jgi:two-component system cell cycle sensor histidine kinase/response regulator CckA
MRVLIFEDDALDAELIEYELERAAVACATCRVESRDEFVRALETFAPDLILSDYAVPRFDGMAALAVAREVAPTVPFIIVTGSVNEETAVRCMHAGASDYLIKNNLARLGPAIRSALEREQSRAEKLRAECALRRSEADLRAIFDSSPQAFVLTDPDGTIKAFNRTAAEWAARVGGWQLVEGGRLGDLAPPGELELWDDCFRAALLNRPTTREWSLPDAGGTQHWYETSHVPVVDDTSRVVGVCLSVADTDERKRMEEQLLKAERLQASGKLAGGLAHEINNMMTAVIGLGTFLARGLPPTDPRTGDAEEIIRTAQRVAGLTRQLLAFTRQQVLRPVLLDLNEVVRGAEHMLRRSIGEDVELEVRLAPDLGSPRADPAQLEQVLTNLVINARDAIPGRGRITIETRGVELDEQYARSHAETAIPTGPYVLLAVSDTGGGMTPQVRARIFEPFFTTKPVGQGTGLGLSTVYGIVKQSGGFVWAYSEPGLGSTFKVYLPVAGVRDIMLDPVQPTPNPMRGTETIVVVEDEDVVRELLTRTLRNHGYRVVEAPDGLAALQLIRNGTSPVDLVLTDVVMPIMGGQELSDALASDRPAVPVLYISGFAGADVVRRGLLKAGTPVLEKPFTPATLVGKVREMLDRRGSNARAASGAPVP